MVIGILLALIPLLLVVTAFIGGFAWFLAKSSLTPAPSARDQTPADFGLPFEDFTIQNDGIRLAGWFIPGSGNGTRKKPTVVLSHGWGRNAAQMLPHAAYLQEAGFNLVLYDLRGHGESQRVEISSLNRMASDLRAVLAYTRARKEVRRDAIGLFGHSMGAAVSLLAAAEDTAIKAVVSSSAFADLNDLISIVLESRHVPQFLFKNLVRRFWRTLAGTELDAISPGKQVHRIGVPILLLHGEGDQTIPPEQLDLLAASAGSAEKQLIPGRNHSDLHEDETYRGKVLHYFRERLREQEK